MILWYHQKTKEQRQSKKGLLFLRTKIRRQEGEVMAGYENIRDKGFDTRSTEELREIQSKGGRNSGKSRRKKASFRKVLNALLTTEIDNPEWTPFLEAMGIDSTLEAAVNAAMIREALAGSVKAYEAIAKYSGQSQDSEQDVVKKDLEIQRLRQELERQKAMTEKLEAETEKIRAGLSPEEGGADKNIVNIYFPAKDDIDE